MTQYSHSRLSCFEKCPKQFEYRYIQKVEVQQEGVEAFVGKRVHEILERLYHHVSRHGRPPTLAQVLERFRKDWALHWHDNVTIVRSENSADFYVKRGEHCIENYYRGYYPFEEGETLALEHRVSLTLDREGRYTAQGIVDRLTRRNDGTVEIHDYKTGNYVPRQKELDLDRQLALYQLGVQQSMPEVDSVELVWHYLAHARTLRSKRSADQLETLCEQTIQLIDRIEATEQYDPTPSPLCRWCDFRALCPVGPRDSEEAQLPIAAAAPPAPPAPSEAAALEQVPGDQLALL